MSLGYKFELRVNKFSLKVPLKVIRSLPEEVFENAIGVIS